MRIIRRSVTLLFFLLISSNVLGVENVALETTVNSIPHNSDKTFAELLWIMIATLPAFYMQNVGYSTRNKPLVVVSKSGS